MVKACTSMQLCLPFTDFFLFFFAHPTAVAGVTSSFARADIPRHLDDPWYHGDISSWEAEKRLTAKDLDGFLVRKSRSQHTLYTKYEGAVKPTPAKPRGSRKANPSQNEGKLLTSSI